MRISDLLDRRVVDAAGHRLGRVREVRLVPVPGSDDDVPVYRVDGLVVGHPLDGDRLGYGRTVHAPRLLAVTFAALRRRQRYVRWVDVDRAGRTIVLAATRDELSE